MVTKDYPYLNNAEAFAACLFMRALLLAFASSKSLDLLQPKPSIFE